MTKYWKPGVTQHREYEIKAKMDRYDRQKRIQNWRQETLSKARVLVFGAGALGNEVLKNLALIGAGHILVVDFDHIELSNLSRTVLFRESDIGKSKAETAARAIKNLNPDVDIRSIHGNIFFDIGLGFFRHADLVISGLDNIAARSHVGICCALAGTPFLDGGMWAGGGEVRWFTPGETACFECTLTDEDRKHAFERRSCTGFRIEEGIQTPVPSTMSVTAVIAGLMTQEAIRFFQGENITGGEAIVYNGVNQSMHHTEFSRDPDCPYHHPYENIIELAYGVNDITAKDLLLMAQKETGESGVLELGRDYLLGFQCTECNEYEPIDSLLALVNSDEALCKKCEKTRKAEILSRIMLEDLNMGKKLNELGAPLGEIISVHSNTKLRLFEFTKDIHRFWKE